MSKENKTPGVTEYKRRNKWYARVRTWDGIKKSEITIPLGENSEQPRIRFERRKIIKNSLQLIKQGEIPKSQFKEFFPWLNDNGTSALISMKLKDAVNEFLAYRSVEKRKNTIRRDKISLEQFMKVVSANKPIRQISKADIDDPKGFKDVMKKATYGKQNKPYKPAGINISLTHIKIFLNWCYEKKYIAQKISFKKLDEGQPEISNFTEMQLKQIFDLNNISPFIRSYFHFLFTTGCRPSEPFLGTIKGSYLKVPGLTTKNRAPRNVHLSEQNKETLKNIQAFRDSRAPKEFDKKVESAYKYFSDQLRKRVLPRIAANGDRVLSLKSFRHSYCIFRITYSGSIADVQKEMGHTKSTTTDRYNKIDVKERLDDFPSLKKYVEARGELAQNRGFGEVFSGNNLLQ